MTKNRRLTLEAPPDLLSTLPAAASTSREDVCEEETQLNEEALRQFNQINLAALTKVVSRLRGKACIPLIQNTRFERSNIVIYLSFEDDSEKWLARFPLIGVTGYHDLLEEHIDSMVATMKYVREKTSIPVPRVHLWGSNSSNEFGRPYIIMDFLPGNTLYDLERSGHDMNRLLEGLTPFVDQWAQYHAELTSLEFTQIGSLTSSDGTIGPLCTPAHLHFSTLLNSDTYRGPFTSTLEYLLTTSEYKCRSLATSALGHSYQVFLQNKILEGMVPYFVELKYARGPFVLKHMNLDLENILVEAEDRKGGVRIMGVVGWEFAHIGPLQSQMCLPESLNVDKMGEKEKEIHTDWSTKFAETYRDLYKQRYLQHLRRLNVDFPEHLLDHGHWFTKFENALSIGSAEACFTTLWAYIYGTHISWQKTIENIESSDWGIAMAERFSSDAIEYDDDGKNTIIVSHSRPQTRATFRPTWKPKVKWRMRVMNNVRWGLWRVEQCLLCQWGEKRVAVLMRSKRRTTVSEITEIGKGIEGKDQ